jgi:hypothetical protein
MSLWLSLLSFSWKIIFKLSFRGEHSLFYKFSLELLKFLFKDLVFKLLKSLALYIFYEYLNVLFNIFFGYVMTYFFADLNLSDEQGLGTVSSNLL